MTTSHRNDHVSMSDVSDEDIARRVQDGEQELFGILIERYESKLKRYGTKFFSNAEDVTDLVQDAFLKAYQNIKSFDTALRFSPWMYRIAHNEFVTALRKRSRASVITVDFDTFIAHPTYADPAQALREQKEMRELIERGLEKIKPKYREVLVLFYLEELSYAEIADILHVPSGTVGIRLKRAREALAHIYKDSPHVHESLS